MNCHQSREILAQFYDGHSAIPSFALTRLKTKTLEIQDQDTNLLVEWSIQDLKLEKIGSKIILRNKALRAHLVIQSELAKQIVLTWGLQGYKRGSVRQKWALALTLLALNVLIGVSLYKSLTPVSYWLAHKVPPSYEKRYLDHPFVQKFLESSCSDPEAEEALAIISERLLSVDPDLEVDVKVLNWSMVNAFALPGGQVVLTNGLLRQADSPEQIAGVLAHEFQHVKYRHVFGEYIRAGILSYFWAILMGDYSGVLVVNPDTLHLLTELNFSRSAEEEADVGAIVMLQKAEIGLEGFQEFFDKLSERERKFWVPEILSSHPQSNRRAEMVRLAQQDKQGSRPVLSDEQFQALKAICNSQNEDSE